MAHACCVIQIFKVAMYVKHLKLESVNQTGADLTKICDQSYQAAVVQDPINHLNVRWVDMMTTVVRRQVSAPDPVCCLDVFNFSMLALLLFLMLARDHAHAHASIYIHMCI